MLLIPWLFGQLLAAVLVIAALMNFTRRDIAYTAVILWALVGISVCSRWKLDRS